MRDQTIERFSATPPKGRCGAGRRGLAIACLATLAVAAPATAADEVLSFCYDPYPPYTLGGEGPAEGGLKMRLLNAVVEQIDGVAATVVLMPWKRCHAEVKAGRLDGILPLYPNAERATYLSFTGGVIDEESAFWYSRERFPDELDWAGDFAALSHLTLGMLNGSYIDEGMEAAFEQGAGIQRAPNVTSLMLMLLNGRVDLIATDRLVGVHHVAENGWSDLLAAVERPIASRQSRFGLSLASDADRHLAAFDEAIGALRESGEIDAILRDFAGAAPED